MFDLSKDISERNDLAKQMPQEAQRLKGRLDKYLLEVNAQMPLPNSDYDPSQPFAPRKGGKKGADKR